MSNIKELKELVGQVNLSKNKSVLVPYKELSSYIIQIETMINSLEESQPEPKPKPRTRRRSTKVTEE